MGDADGTYLDLLLTGDRSRVLALTTVFDDPNPAVVLEDVVVVDAVVVLLLGVKGLTRFLESPAFSRVLTLVTRRLKRLLLSISSGDKVVVVVEVVVACVARWQNLIPSFPWIAPGWRAWSQSKERKGSNFAA